MTRTYKHCALAAAIALMLSACGKKNSEAPEAPATASAEAAPAGSAAPRYKKTEKFGTVSAVDLVPLFAVPQQYSGYVHQEVTETTNDEYHKLPESAFQAYVKTWLTQAASSDKPDWTTLAALVYPDSTEEANAFKKQEAADKVKSTLVIDKNALNVAFAWQGNTFLVRGPDVANGEYYLTITQHNSYRPVSYTDPSKYNTTLFYVPHFDALGLQGSRRGDIEFTVKVPIEKAKEIEALREHDPMIVRVYGHVKGISTNRLLLRKKLSEANLDVDVQALEFGIRRNGAFQTLLFLDSDQLRKGI